MSEFEKNPIDTLLNIMTRLRDPENGCPWDVEQTFETIAPHTIEEAYEVAEAIANKDMDELKSELGDLMFQVVFYSQMAKEEGAFSFNDVLDTINEKMIHRHPHVFGETQIADADAQIVAWEETKAEERRQKSIKSAEPLSALDGVANALPALTRSVKLQNRAARVGFDWPDINPVFDKIDEEMEELKVEIKSGISQTRIEEEYGDLLFVIANLGRHLGLDAEIALKKANKKFTRRFKGVEEKLSNLGKSPKTSDLDEMETLWGDVKSDETKE
ncbi:MAG: nucleoside triphosphate pyrophosphohydrolase [Sneathiella sp.]